MRSLLLMALGVLGCGGGASTGPSPGPFAGTYRGTVYAISSSTVPVKARDSTSGGAVTLLLTSTGGEAYTLSSTSTTGGASTGVTVNSAGTMSFPNFDEAAALNLVGSFTTGICVLNSSNARPSGSVVDRELVFTLLVSGAICDWSGNGSDLRATLIQVTWTGTKS